MRNHAKRNRVTLSLACLLGLLLLLTGADALAKKGGGGKPPPPDPDPLDVGTIYFTEGYAWDELYQVQSDGSGDAALDLAISGGAEPSLLRHQDSSGEAVRWFLQREVADAAYQLYAVSENGDMVRLVDDPTLNVGGSSATYVNPCWADDDRLVGFCAVRYDRPVNLANGDKDPWAVPIPEETGQYLLTIDPVTMTPVGEPVFVPLDAHIGPVREVYEPDENGDPILVGYEGCDAAGNLGSELSPGGSSIVYRSWDVDAGAWRTWRADATDWTQRFRPPALAEDEYMWLPRWSPDEAWLCGVTGAGVELISAESSDRQVLVADPDDSITP